MNAHEQDFDTLVSRWIVIARQMLEEQGYFHPYAAALLQNGAIDSFSADTQEGTLDADELIEILRSGLRRDIQFHGYIASAIFYDAFVENPVSKNKTDAIAILLYHENGNSLKLYIPYQIQEKKCSFGEQLSKQIENSLYLKSFQ